MVKAKRDVVNSLMLLTLCAAAYYATSLIPAALFGKTDGALFPQIVITTLAFLAVLYLINSLVKVSKGADEKLQLSIMTWIKENKNVVLIFVTFAAYVVALPWIGYLVSSMLFLLASHMVLAMKRTKLWIVALSIIAVTFILMFVFENALSVFLPEGVLF